jgi:hypothetical protein
MTATVTKTKDNFAALKQALLDLRDNEVLVGFPADKDKPRDKGEPITNAALGFIQDHGSPAANIPARPFMVQGIALVQTRIDERLEQTANLALDGGDVMRGYAAVGETAAQGIKTKINTGPFLKLSKATIMARLRRGKKSNKPLVDSAQMRNAVTWVIRRRKR